ncbi:hypothetical protein HEP89_04110 [Labrenzia sp. 5N]|uniref:plasmid mobilization protein n=1 Tax=Labrenzia sp. 5N TaxID=2723402 RepID=UPI0014458A24|nr:hypothetical protein [Labrenzia sp. 5N]NKX63272.1 hypothetical protein [Labrenzia sp. 5N]
MNPLDREFNKSADKSEKLKYPPPFSLRLTFEERALLERQAAGMSLGAYIRSQILGDDVTPRRTRGKFPVKDQAALGRVLAGLGASRLSANLNQLARAVNTGILPVTPETDESLKEACAAIEDMRCALMEALGKGPESGP